MREQPASVFGVEWIVRTAEASGESMHLSFFTGVLINICTRSIAHQNVYFKKSILTHCTFLTVHEAVVAALLNDSQVTF